MQASAAPENVEALWQRLWPRSRLLEPLSFHRAPVLAAVLWFAFGIAASRWYLPAVELVLAAISLALISVLALRRSLRIAILPVAALWFVLGWCCAEVEPVPAPVQQAALLHDTDGLSRMLRGRVVRMHPLPKQPSSDDAPQDHDEWEAPGGAALATVDVAVDAIEDVTPDVSRMAPTSGGVRLTVFDGVPTLRCGDVIAVPLRLKAPVRYDDPGAWQYADYLLQQGIGAHASVRAASIRHVSNGGASLPCRLAAMQSWAAERLLHFVGSTVNQRSPRGLRLSLDDAGMLNAMLFGDRTRLRQELRVGFERTGSFHLFVVSGLHVALLAGALWWLLRRLRVAEVPATLLTLGLTASYALLTGFGVPVQRALAMAAVVLIGRLLTREHSILNALGAAALLVLAASPHALFEASFQMTFLAIVAIGGIALPLGEWSITPWLRAARQIDAIHLDTGMTPMLAQFRVMLRLFGEPLGRIFGRWARALPAWLARAVLWLCELALLGIVTECCMALPMAIYFHRATVFALPANMLSVPLVAVIAPLGMLTFLGSLLSPWLALLPAWMTALLLHGVSGAIGRLSALRVADWRVPDLSLGVVAGCALGIAAACGMVRRGRWQALGAAGVLALVPLAVLWPEPPRVHAGVLEVTALDVWQGDSLLVVSPEGRTMLVDAGGPVGMGAMRSVTSGFDVGEDVVSPYLWSRRLRRLDVVVLTHAHSDHMGGMPAVLRNLRPRELWVSIDPGSESYRALLREAAALGIPVRHWHAGEAQDWGGLHITALAPEAGYANPGPPVNDDSLVLRLDYQHGSALLEGDAEAPEEQAMLAHSRVQPVSLLKVGHHGSLTSTTPEFLAAARPRDAVVSAGKGNTFGHPRFEVVQRLGDAKVKLFRTDEMGCVSFLVSGDGGVSAAACASNR